MSFEVSKRVVNTEIKLGMKKLADGLTGSLLLRAEGDGSDIRAIIGMMPRVRRFSETGGLIISSLKDWKWALTNEPFGAGVEIPRLDWLRNSGKIIRDRAKLISQRCNESVLLETLPLLEQGKTTALGSWFIDELSFFNTAHFWKGGKVQTTWGNNVSVNVDDPTAPTVEELADAWDTGVDLFYSMIDDFGQRIHPSPEANLYAIFPPNMRRGAKALLNNSIIKLDSVAQENPYKGAASLHLEGGLTTTTSFYIGIGSSIERPFVHQLELIKGKAWDILISDPDGPYGQTNNAVLVTATGQQQYGYLWPHMMVRVDLT